MIRSIALFFLLFHSSLISAEISRGPYLQLAHETGVTIVWRSGAPMSDPRVVYSEEGSDEELICDGKAVLRRTMKGEYPLSKAPEGVVQYEAVITGLGPGETFSYAIYDGKKRLTESDPSYHFTTHPKAAVPKPTRVWVVGDSGTGRAHQLRVHEAMQRRTAREKRPLDVYLHVGDMAYGQGTDEQFQEKFFEPYRETLRHTVCWASMGNHEGRTSNGKTGVGPFYDAYVCPRMGEAGGVASGSESFYSFDYGNIHFICLNSYDIDRKPDGEMAKWLVKDLAAVDPQSWIIGFWHHPPYTKGTHDSDKERELIEMRKHIMPILETGGVDLVLSGHSHIYERSMLIDGAYETPTTADGVVLDDGDGNPDGDGAYRKPGELSPNRGTVAIVTGHGGALGRNSKGVMPIMRSIVLDHGSTILDIDGETLTGIMLDLRGEERDRFSIVRKGKVEKSIVSNSWKATQATEERTGEGVLGAPGTVANAKQSEKAGAKHVPKLMPRNVKHIIEPNAAWDYLAGGEAPETEMWTKLGFDAKEEGWKSGKAGFGYGDGDDQTVLDDMRNKYTAIYVRRVFNIPAGTNLKRLGLSINYDDGFVLYVNGEKILSKQVELEPDGSVKVGKHESSGAEYFPLSEFHESFKIGKNVIAFECHNVSLNSSDLSLDPFLVLEVGK